LFCSKIRRNFAASKDIQDNIFSIKVGANRITNNTPPRVKKRKGKKMKKMILTMVAMLSMTMAFAEGENMNSVNNVAAYDMSCNMNKLAEALSLTADQREAVENIYQTFTAEMMFAAQYSNDQRKEMVKKALEKNVAWMRYVLNDKQSHTYLMLLNTTINNRGLNK
jgi:hypothetical protein